jgi:hypothetical protein
MKLGDHIRTFANGRFDHAIDCGDLTVIHLFPLPDEAGRAEVRRSRLSDFTTGAERVEVVGYPARGYPPRMVVARAFSRLGASAAEAMFPSPEHFATWCVNGQVPAHPSGPVAPALSPDPRPARPTRGAPPRKPSKKRAARRKAGPRRPARRKAPARAKVKRPGRKGRTPSPKASRKGARRRR